MTSYLGEPAYEHGSRAATGALLVNLGTPDAPTPAAVRRFLAEFLWDPRVVEAPRWLWWLALHGVILRIRPSRSAHAYRQIWTPEGSPLLLHTRALVDRVRGTLQRHLPATVDAGNDVRLARHSRSARAAAQRRRAATRRAAAVPAVLGHDDGIGVRPRDVAAATLALGAGAALHRQLSRRTRLHRRDRDEHSRALADARTRAPAVLLPRHTRAATCSRAIRITANA